MPPMSPAVRDTLGLPTLTEEQAAEPREKVYLKAKPWAHSNERVGTEDWCI
ncbi:MAG: hypothetical protein ABIH92_03275 [Nanoarchaeota archaeon]